MRLLRWTANTSNNARYSCGLPPNHLATKGGFYSARAQNSGLWHDAAQPPTYHLHSMVTSGITGSGGRSTSLAHLVERWRVCGSTSLLLTHFCCDSRVKTCFNHLRQKSKTETTEGALRYLRITLSSTRPTLHPSSEHLAAKRRNAAGSAPRRAPTRAAFHAALHISAGVCSRTL